MELVPIRCRIPEILHRMGKNQQWLANVSGISKHHMSDIIHLRASNITIRRAKLISYHLGCTLDELFEWGWRQQE